MKHSIRRGLGTLALALVCLGVTSTARASDPRQIVLADQNGTAFDLADLQGRPVVLTFVSTRCTDACPIADAAFDSLAQRLRRERISAQLLTITLDPEYDTPFVMAGVAHRFAADAREWRLASGAPGNVRRLMRAFNVTADKDEHGIPEIHSTFVYVIDAHGRLARTLLLSSNIVDDAARLLHDKTFFTH